MIPKDIKAKPKNIQKAFFLMLGAVVSFSVMALFVKLAASQTTTTMTIFFRFSISCFYILSIFGIRAIKKQKLYLKTNHIYLHIIRAIVSMLAMLTFYYSLKYIPLVVGNLLILTSPLYIPILASVFLKSKTSKKHLIAILIGFVGVAIVLKPGFSFLHYKSLYALLSGFLVAITYMFVRKISKHDHHHTSMFYYFVFAFFLSSVLAVFTWQTPDLKTFLLLIGVGVFGTAYQEFLIRASIFASSKVTSSFMYLSLVFSTVFSYVIFNESLDMITIAGMILILIGSILTIQNAKKLENDK